MSNSLVGDGWARVSVPAWMQTKQVLGYLEECGYQVRNSSTQGILVRTIESYIQSKPGLISVSKAEPKESRHGRWSPFVLLDDDDVLGDSRAELKGHIDSALSDSPESIVGLVNHYRLYGTMVSSGDLEEQVRLGLQEIRDMRFTEDGSIAFPDAEIFAVRRSKELLHRLKLVSVLLRIEYDPQAQSGDLSQIQSNHASGEDVFASAAELHSGAIMLDPYYGPVLGAMSPFVWGFAAFRGTGPLIFSFGRGVNGSTRSAPELLRTLLTQGSDGSTEYQELSKGSPVAAIRWWSDRLNELFAVITDPAVFRDREGIFRPVLQLQAVLTVEQIFRRMTSLQVAHHDRNSRRVMLFTILDSLESLTGKGIEKTASPRFASDALGRLEAALDVGAAEVLLPRAKDAVASLEELQSGFFLRQEDGSVLVDSAAGKSLGIDRATAEYVKLLRNATHGHGSIKESTLRLTESLIARHNGHVPHNLGFLAWLHLLELLSDSAVVRKNLTVRSSRYRRV